MNESSTKQNLSSKSLWPALSGHYVDPENLVRRALDVRVGRALTDTEWADARDKLIQFAIILRQWQPHGESEEAAVLPPEAA